MIALHEAVFVVLKLLYPEYAHMSDAASSAPIFIIFSALLTEYFNLNTFIDDGKVCYVSGNSKWRLLSI
jgi:hypothetical protein